MGYYDRMVITVYDGTGTLFAFETNGNKPDLIGHHYELKNVKGVLLNDGFCQEDLHYFRHPGKEPIPKGTEVVVISHWINFYGTYFRVEYDNRYYDIDTKDIKLIRTKE